MANLYDSSTHLIPIIGGQGNANSNLGFALNTNYLLGTDGNCFGVRFPAPLGGVHIHSVYFFLHAADAVGANLTCDIANYGASTSAAGSSIRAVTAAGGITANTWVKFDFSAFSDTLTPGNYYWVVIGDAAGGNPNGYQVRNRSSGVSILFSNIHWVGYTSTNGFTTNGTGIGATCSAIIVFSNGMVIGNPYTTIVADTNNTLERGLKISGLTEQIQISALFFNPTSNMSTLQIYEGATVPGGTVWDGFNGGSAYTLSANEKGIGFCWLPNIITFSKETIYRITFKYSVGGVTPAYNIVENQATLGQDGIDCSLAQGRYCRTIDNGAGGWTDNDGTNNLLYLPRISLVLYDQVSPTYSISANEKVNITSYF